MSRLRSGFTLIELLVVIAIIAILAAILFPVFAQAREKARQSSCLSNQKQTALAVLQYVQDYDETYPLAFWRSGPDGYNEWGYPYYNWVPANWSTSIDAYEASLNQSVFPNSTQAYMKNYQILACPSSPDFEDPAVAGYYTTRRAGVPAVAMTITYNGYLNMAAEGQINAPSNAVMFWEGFGKAGAVNIQNVNPLMICDNPNDDCTYKPTQAGCSAGANGGSSGWFTWISTAWVHGKGMNFTFTDGHVKWRPMASVVSPGVTQFGVDPMRTYDSQGVPTGSHRDVNNCHLEFFRLEK